MTANADDSGVAFGVECNVPRGEGNAARRREHDRRVGAGTMSRSGVQCPLCQAIMTMQDLRLDGRARRLGEVMTAVVVDGPHGKEYRLPTELELQAARVEEAELDTIYAEIPFGLPDEPTPSEENLGMRVPRYGFDQWRTLFTNRQLLALGTFVQEIRRLPETMAAWPEAWREAVVASLTPTIDRLADRGSTLATWTNDREKSAARSPASRYRWSGTSWKPVPWRIRAAALSRRWSGRLRSASTCSPPRTTHPHPSYCDSPRSSHRPPPVPASERPATTPPARHSPRPSPTPARKGTTASTSSAPTRPTTTPFRTPT